MNFGKLYHVVAVDRFGSISHAARQLNITQSAVTKSVADIEREIGYPLFHRHTRGVVSTQAGRAFIDRASRLVADMEQLRDDSRTELQSRELVLRVAISPASLEDLLTRTICNFISANPSVRVHLRATSIENGTKLLQQGDVDLCIGGRERLESIDEFSCDPLPDLHASLYARRGHPLDGRAELHTSALEPFPIIVPDLKSPYIDRLVGQQSSFLIPSRRLHIIENYRMVANIVASTDAIGIISTGYSQTEPFRRRFCTLHYDLGTTLPLAVASRTAWPDTRQVLNFRSVLRDSFLR